MGTSKDKVPLQQNYVQTPTFVHFLKNIAEPWYAGVWMISTH